MPAGVEPLVRAHIRGGRLSALHSSVASPSPSRGPAAGWGSGLSLEVSQESQGQQVGEAVSPLHAGGEPSL